MICKTIKTCQKSTFHINYQKQTMNILKIIILLITIAEADLIGFNRLGNNVLSFNQNGKNALYGSHMQRQPRYKFRANKIQMMRRYYKTQKLD